MITFLIVRDQFEKGDRLLWQVGGIAIVGILCTALLLIAGQRLASAAEEAVGSS